ncbi:MAG: preprotein translocase subunit YajC, partial [Planctomycetota bacterium]
MKMTWILAQTGNGEAPSTITSEPVGSEDVETMTKEAADPNAGPGTGARRGPFGDFWTIGLIAIMMIVVFTFFRGPRKQQQQHRKMLQSLEKNDRVRTIGGMIGTVVEIK